jgi:5'-3' exonuclease
MPSIQIRFRTLLRSAVTLLTNCLAGVGPKRAAELLRRYGTLEGVLKAGLFKTQAEMLRLYRLIATMNAKAPLPTLTDQEPTWASASNLARAAASTASFLLRLT